MLTPDTSGPRVSGVFLRVQLLLAEVRKHSGRPILRLRIDHIGSRLLSALDRASRAAPLRIAMRLTVRHWLLQLIFYTQLLRIFAPLIPETISTIGPHFRCARTQAKITSIRLLIDVPEPE